MSGGGALAAAQIALGVANEAIPEEMAAGPIGWVLAAATGLADAASAAVTIYNATQHAKSDLKAKAADQATTTCGGGNDDEPEGQKKKKRKPLQPNRKKWIAKGGTVTDNPDGSTTYVDPQGNDVTYNKSGYPDFSKYSKFTFKSEKLTGNYKIDNNIGDKIYKENEGENTPSDYTWHHVEDGQTMELVPRELHQDFSHTGGVSILNGGK